MTINIIEAKNLSFSYSSKNPALENLNFSVKPGQFMGILGANGCGKTTLLKILNALLKPEKGDVYLEGKNIKSISRDILFRKVCTCFQNPDDQLFSPTVREDIAFGPINMGLSKQEVKKIVDYALGAVQMSEFADKLIHHLSFGQKKRVCLAGVLAMEPKIMLLDEPTSGLDPHGVNSIMRLLKRLNKQKGITMIMSTHSVDLVPLFIDRLIILSKGRLTQEGLPQDVFNQPQKVRLADLRLPRIGHLFEVLRNKDNFPVENLPLTIGEARHQLLKLIS